MIQTWLYVNLSLPLECIFTAEGSEEIEIEKPDGTLYADKLLVEYPLPQLPLLYIIPSPAYQPS